MTLPTILGLTAIIAPLCWPRCTYRKVGGLRFIRVGRFGASFFISNKGN